MQVLFTQPASPQSVDDRFDLEMAAIEELGVQHAVLSLERIIDDELDDVLADLDLGEDDTLYRGWMLTRDEYERLYDALADRGATLTTTPDEYEAAHYLPSWIDGLAAHSPMTRWIDGTDIDEAWAAAQGLPARSTPTSSRWMSRAPPMTNGSSSRSVTAACRLSRR